MLNRILRRFTKNSAGMVSAPIVAQLPNQVPGEGRLNVGSLTWAFIRTWATEELNNARVNNDSMVKDSLQTAALRGRIKVLKEILALPEPSRFADRGLLAKEDDPTFAGY